jgi:DNA mismatch endonuclease, patch repair protein
MQGNRSRDTRPEIALRRLLFARGLRYRVCARPLPQVRRTADLVFRSAKVAIDVRGCFWHGCPEHYKAPATNPEYWAEKLRINISRDNDTRNLLNEAGWLLVEVWEHDDLQRAAEEIAVIVSRRQPRAVSRTNAG